MANPATKTQVISLYRQFLRSGSKFGAYNFRDYAIRRARDGFRSHMNEADPEKISAFIKKAEQELKVVQRQSTISSMFNSGQRLIIEEQRIVRTAGDN
ncbi:hypothetical protein K450DRAFT_219066 [Umbelopsis ramanniana AG]|uniref:Complex 1 LYR protein domain-containing protein n=1 Tax=Umbelopsis ramanniana AG TaxID=1314678 RepID=A0AAD5EJ50_UMBRA|nr:uncharacterized protein K450DRAFT_219066 [Umbelopsis ramanniana AG]KAI8584277.1 hypothetical protein K450DRAFT_219066 [Umbelopsis ramanniana AG]